MRTSTRLVLGIASKYALVTDFIDLHDETKQTIGWRKERKPIEIITIHDKYDIA